MNNQYLDQQQQDAPAESNPEQPEQILQVIYERSQDGSYFGVGANLVLDDGAANQELHGEVALIPPLSEEQDFSEAEREAIALAHQQTSRATSTLPSVLEESSSGEPGTQTEWTSVVENPHAHATTSRPQSDLSTNQGGEYDSEQVSQALTSFDQQGGENPQHYYVDQGSNLPSAIYSIVNKPLALENRATPSAQGEGSYLKDAEASGQDDDTFYSDAYPVQDASLQEQTDKRLSIAETEPALIESEAVEQANENIENLDEEIGKILSRLRQGAVESGSFRNNFRRKQNASRQSSNDTEPVSMPLNKELDAANSGDTDDLPMKRAHSTRSSRLSVDIRNLPSYLTGKRASIVDVAKGAMSSLMHSLNSGAGSSVGSQRRDSIGSLSDDEPIFEEPIAPTLSLGQRVALVQQEGTEFGTVGWIGQLPDVDDDWIVGVIFDNMIGNCDGAYKGVRYFYARENYAMFVPLSALTKTDNYIGRPETGTMLSRMSVQLKPGQLISIQRSSIRLQHCFLNAPHQRVGHDVRAVSNRLHCQCHNCGPCAHLTKQSRVGALPHFGAMHTHNGKKNSLVKAAIELLSHHHHHIHEEEEHDKENEDHQFGDNAAHACNYVRYSCCQQAGVPGHDFLSDCEMVRPELLDNLIHAPKAPHRRSRIRRRKKSRKQPINAMSLGESTDDAPPEPPKVPDAPEYKSSTLGTEASGKSINKSDLSGMNDTGESSGSSCSSRASSRQRNEFDFNQASQPILDAFVDYTSDCQPRNDVYNTQISFMDQHRFVSQRDSTAFIQSQMSIASDDTCDRSPRFGSSLRRCFKCLFSRRSRERKGRNRQSARNRLAEFRRKQSTFIPSTLAKPQDDFATHGMIMPPFDYHGQTASNSDYSSGSRSSGSSDGGSPFYDNYGARTLAQETQDQSYDLTTQQNFNGGVKSCDARDLLCSDKCDSLDELDCCKKTLSSNQSYYTHDLGFYDAYTSSSNDTLKHIVDQSINEQVLDPSSQFIGLDAITSPVVSSSCSNCQDHIEVSSPTVSLAEPADEQLSTLMGSFDLEEKSNETGQ